MNETKRYTQKAGRLNSFNAFSLISYHTKQSQYFPLIWGFVHVNVAFPGTCIINISTFPEARKAVVSTNVTVVDTFSVVIVALVITGVVVLVGVSRAHSDDQGAKD